MPEGPPNTPHPRAPDGTPLYVHLPFCVHKCPYCDFFSIVGQGEDLDGFIEILLAEIALRAPREPRTVFFGGGTPSYFSSVQLERLLDGLELHTGFRGSAVEVTAECNPESLNVEKALALRALGVNRLSVGVQSLDPTTLEFFERPHTPEEALAAVDAVRVAEFRRWSVDLIHGAPVESLDILHRNLLEIINLGPTHVSAYGLTYEPGTPLHARLERGAFEPQGEEDELRNLAETRRTLEGAGLMSYEVSNFSTNGEECVHNINYWKNGPYVGLGPSAASHVLGTRSGNARSLARWKRAVTDHDAAPAWQETLNSLARLGETWWLGLRLAEGVDPAEARGRAGWDAATPDPTRPVAAELEQRGHLERVGERLRIPESALPIADHIGKQFLALEP